MAIASALTERNSDRGSLRPTRPCQLPPRGRCRGYPSEVFFPEGEDRQFRRGCEQEAKQICGGCAVLARCRDHALNTPEVHGIWGAMTARERARVLSVPPSVS